MCEAIRSIADGAEVVSVAKRSKEGRIDTVQPARKRGGQAQGRGTKRNPLPRINPARRSYRILMGFSAWRMYDREGNYIASVRAWSLKEAREVFTYHGFTGNRVRKVLRSK